jgi:hypothetical protein
LLQTIAKSDVPTSAEEAVELARKFIAAFPQGADSVFDPKTYGSALTGVLQQYSIGVVKRLVSVDRDGGGLRHFKFRPSVAELIEWLDGEANKVRGLRYGAQWMLEERERLLDEKVNEKAYAPSENDRLAMLARFEVLLAELRQNARLAGEGDEERKKRHLEAVKPATKCSKPSNCRPQRDYLDDTAAQLGPESARAASLVGDGSW